MTDDSRRQRPAGDDDVEAAFADIIANWHRTAGYDEPRRSPLGEPTEAPASTDATAAPGDDLAGEQSHRPRTVEEVFGSAAPAEWRSWTPSAEPEADFIPPEPGALPRYDLGFWGALAGVVGGPLTLVLLTVFAPGVDRFWFFMAIAATFAGFALLVARLPARGGREEESDGDGAVV